MNELKLYQISDQFNDAMNDLLYNDEIPDDAKFDTLEGMELQFNEKAQAVTAYILNEDALIEVMENHVKAIQSKIKTKKANKEWLRDYLKTNMEKSGIAKIQANDGTFSVTLTKGRESVVIDDESLLPESCFVVKRELSKTAVKALLDEGEIEGAHMERKAGLMIK